MNQIRSRAAAAVALLLLGMSPIWTGACSRAAAPGGVPPPAGGPHGPDFADARARIDELVDRGNASVAVAVVKDGRILWEEAFGWEDVATRRRASVHSRYPIGSVSKPFTATAVMILAERGDIDLAAPANRYLGTAQLTRPDGGAGQATVRDLLQHRGGLPSPHVTRFYLGETRQPPGVEETIRRYGVLIDAPGRRFAYSNLGYGALAHMVARISRVTFAQFLTREVFEPLGMTDTSIELDAIASRPGVTPYCEGRPVPGYRFDEEGSGRVWSSAHDLARFALFHLGEPLADQRPVLSERNRVAMAADARSTAIPGSAWGGGWFYGLGWGGREADEHNHARWYGHDGGIPGALAELRLIPDRRLAVVVLSNDERVPTKEILELILDAMIPGSSWTRREDPARGRRTAASFAAPADLIGSWSGEIRTWSASIPIQLDVRRDGARVRLGSAAAVGLDGLEVFDGRLRGRSPGRLPAPDLEGVPYELWYELRRDRDHLVGAVYAADTAPLRHFVLPSWVKMRRIERPQ